MHYGAAVLLGASADGSDGSFRHIRPSYTAGIAVTTTMENHSVKLFLRA